MVDFSPSVQDIVSRQKAQRFLLFWIFVATCCVVFFVSGAVMHWTTLGGPMAALLALSAFIIFAIPVIIWNWPIAGLYILIAGAAIIDNAVPTQPPIITGWIPLYLNIANAIGFFAHTHPIGGIKATPAELIMGWTFLCWLVRSIVHRDLKFEPGMFYIWIIFWILNVFRAFLYGLVTGGQFLTALWEIRAECYFVAAYFMASNLITDRRQLKVLLWISVLGIGLMGILGTAKYIRYGPSVSHQGIMSHEDSLFFNIIFLVVLVLGLAKTEPWILFAALALMPTALIADLENHRRAGIAAFAVAVIPVLMMLAVSLKKRRRSVITFIIGFAVFSIFYLVAFWNAPGALAMPARAFRSKYGSPSSRDVMSDNYRLAENANLNFTRNLNLWWGYGYGKPYATPNPMPYIPDPLQLIIPHNGILWMWMRLGTVGFYCFWMMIALALVRGASTIRDMDDPLVQSFGIICIAMILMLIIYGQYDTQFAVYRSMYYSGALLGVLAVLGKLKKPQEPEVESAG